MGWLKRMRALFLPRRSSEASNAVIAATASHEEALGQREAMTELRREADAVTEQIRAHNAANHFDTWLQEIVRDNMRRR